MNFQFERINTQVLFFQTAAKRIQPVLALNYVQLTAHSGMNLSASPAEPRRAELRKSSSEREKCPRYLKPE